MSAALEDEAPPSDLEVIVARLKDALRRRFGAASDIAAVDVATVGGINRTVLFDHVDGAARRRLVLRQETYTTEFSPFLAPEVQWPLLQVCARHGVPVPEPVFALTPEDRLGRGYVVGFVAGETLPKRLLTAPEFAPARVVFTRQAGETLARLHAIDSAEVPMLNDVPDSIDALGAQRAAYEIYGEPHPVLEYAFRWLERHQPPAAPKVFIHGDFRTGNMLVDPNKGLMALLDWECSRLSAPEDELGWYCSRCWRFGFNEREAGGFDTRDAMIAAYEAAGGRRIDREALRWWEIFAHLRWALYNIMQVWGHVKCGRRAPAFALFGRNTAYIEYDLLMTLMGRYT